MQLLTQKTQERIVWGEPFSVLSSQACWATSWGGGGWEHSVCCGMAPIHPTAPTSSFSSSYCWYWSPGHVFQNKWSHSWLLLLRVVLPVPRCWHEVSMLRMHGFATPVKPRGRRQTRFCQKILNSRMIGSWSSPGGSSHLILRSEVQSGHELQLLWGKSKNFCYSFEDQLYVPHSLKPRSEVCQERQ